MLQPKRGSPYKFSWENMNSPNIVGTSGFQNAQVLFKAQKSRLISRISFRNVLPFWFSEAKQQMGKEFYIKINSKENKDKWKRRNLLALGLKDEKGGFRSEKGESV